MGLIAGEQHQKGQLSCVQQSVNADTFIRLVDISVAGRQIEGALLDAEAWADLCGAGQISGIGSAGVDHGGGVRFAGEGSVGLHTGGNIWIVIGKDNMLRAKDCNYVSSLFFRDCIENATSMTQGGGTTVIASPMLLGITNVIDSLIVVCQFVFEEKRCTMHELITAVQQNWKGHEALRTLLLRRGHFFGNDDALSNGIAQRLYTSFYRYLKDKRNLFGYPFF